jgi:hypothetical protein
MADKGKGKTIWPWKRSSNRNLGMSNRWGRFSQGNLSGNGRSNSTGGLRGKDNHNPKLGTGVMSGRSRDTDMINNPRSRNLNSYLKGEEPDSFLRSEGLGRDKGHNRRSTITNPQDSEMGGMNNTGDMGQDVEKAQGFGKKNLENQYQEARAKDQASYSLSATTIEQQAAKTSNFVGSAYFMNLNLKNVRQFQDSPQIFDDHSDSEL